MLLALLKEPKCFTALDLCSGYYHIKWDKESIPKNAFTTVFGKFKFLRLPFGLFQGQDFFNCLIYDLYGLDKISNQNQGSGYLSYLDDILIYSKTKIRMLINIRQCFQTLMQGLSQNITEQILILQGTNPLLSHLVSGASILPLTDKIETLFEIKIPNQYQRSETFPQSYRLSLEVHMHFTDIAYPLNCLT